MLYQDPLDFPPLTSLENFTVGAGHRPRTRRQDLVQRARALGFSLHPGHRVDRLTVGERQQLELVRLLDQGARALILDEPTTGISDSQKRLLFSALRTLAAQGSSVLLVSHKLEDVMAVCDRVTVLRHGRAVGTVEVPFTPAQVLELMFDQTPIAPPTRDGAPGEAVLQTRGLSADGGRAGLRNCSLTVRRGEVVALAGVEGSGQGLLLRVAAGLVRPRRGSLTLCGKDRRANRWSGVTFLPTARLEEGLVAGLTVAEHFALRGTDRFGAILVLLVNARLRLPDLFDQLALPQPPVEILQPVDPLDLRPGRLSDGLSGFHGGLAGRRVDHFDGK